MWGRDGYWQAGRIGKIGGPIPSVWFHPVEFCKMRKASPIGVQQRWPFNPRLATLPLQ